jgi:hypothetical protein
MKRLLAIAAIAVALVAPAKAQQPTPEELAKMLNAPETVAKMIAPEPLAQWVARYAIYGGPRLILALLRQRFVLTGHQPR